MFKNLIRYSLRSFKRQRSYIIINIIGLSVGIACSLLIALFVINELTYDNFNTKKDRIFRVILSGKIGGQEIIGAFTPAVMGQTLVKEIPEVEAFLRMDGHGPTIIEYNKKNFIEDHVVAADSSFFDFFSIDIIKGDRQNLLNAPRKAVLSESIAKRIFGDENPIDKMLKIGSDTARYTVAGVMSDIPENSHFDASIITSFMTNWRASNDLSWMSNSFSTYLLLKPNTSFEVAEKKMCDLVVQKVAPEVQKFMGITLEDFFAQGNRYQYFLQKLKAIHLDPNIQQQFKAAIDPKFLVIFGCIAILIIVIAAINFMNLSTAQASKRSKEVGIKKIAGSTRGMLITQFLSESFILSFISLVFALIIIKVFLPYLNDLLGTHLVLNLLSAWYIIPTMLLYCILVGFLAGSYPALFLSSFNPYEVLKGSVKNSMKNGRLRRILVTFQFTVSILLIIGTIIMYRQIQFMLNKDVGFDKEQVMVITRADALGKSVKSFKATVKNIPGVINITSSTAVPGRNNNNNGYGMEGRKDESFLMVTNWVDYDFLETYGMKLVSGRMFDESFSTNEKSCLINESAIKNFNIADVEQTRILLPSDTGLIPLQVIGTVKDFNHESLRNPIQPYIFRFKTDDFRWGYISVKLSSGNYANTITEIEKVWKEYASDSPLQYSFIDDDFEEMYFQEKQNAKMAVIFSILAIFIAALGLFGLTSFTVEQRTKEIGVRKALGSSISGIYMELSKEIMVLVSISALIACPFIYYIADKWLQSFYYKISLSLFSFMAGFAIALGIATITISYRIIMAARVNPAQSLKYE